MHPRIRSGSLTKTLGIRVTEDERRSMEVCAGQMGLSLSEWCRRALLQALDISPETRLMLSELLGVRKVFLALCVDVLQGQSLSEQRVRQAVESAEATKYAMADNRIQAFRRQQPNE
jgi:hypothetical protein